MGCWFVQVRMIEGSWKLDPGLSSMIQDRQPCGRGLTVCGPQIRNAPRIVFVGIRGISWKASQTFIVYAMCAPNDSFQSIIQSVRPRPCA